MEIIEEKEAFKKIVITIETQKEADILFEISNLSDNNIRKLSEMMHIGFNDVSKVLLNMFNKWKK